MMQLFIFRFFVLVLNIFLYYRFATLFAVGVNTAPFGIDHIPFNAEYFLTRFSTFS